MGENLILTFICVVIFVLTGYIPSHSASRVKYALLGSKEDRRIGIEPLVEPVAGRFANVQFANVLSRFANVFSRFANV